VVVFSPQIIENFRRKSTDGLSLLFLTVWTAGDIANVLGAILQGVLPTMIILAVYYAFADIVLLGQCFWYRRSSMEGIDRMKPLPPSSSTVEASETTTLLQTPSRSSTSLAAYNASDATHLSPATPFIAPESDEEHEAHSRSLLMTILLNLLAVLLVVGAGVFGWWLSNTPSLQHESLSILPEYLKEWDGKAYKKHANEPSAPANDVLKISVMGQVFGYACAVLYLGSRIPQLVLNAKRKSTEGVSLLFFVFACIGNLTYVLSIFAYEAKCSNRAGTKLAARYCSSREARTIYARYILVNASWLLGSLGTLILDQVILVQFFMYRGNKPDVEQVESIRDAEVEAGRA
jgi:solute carrier family 66 (lysosomal lysine-arginine transporter), member 1